MSGPIGRGVEYIPIGYFYPPPLAQLFIPLRNIDPMWLATGWSLAQVVVLGWLLVAISSAAIGRRDHRSAIAAIALALASYPLQIALYGGNLSGWVAVAVAMLLLGSSRLAGLAAGFATVVKAIPAPLAIAALVAPESRRSVAGTVLLVVAASFALSPASWAAWWSILSNLAPLKLDGLSLAFILGETPVAGIAAAASFVISIAFALGALVRVRRVGLDRPSVACAVGSYLFASPVLWDHYLAALVPLMAATWPTGTRWQRAAIGRGRHHPGIAVGLGWR